MAKKIIPKEELPERVWSDKYQCNISKANAIWDEKQNSWINEFIENQLKK